MTTYSPGDAQDAIAGLVGAGAVVPLTDPILVAQVMDGGRQAYADICKERDELADRIQAARQDVWPYLNESSQRGTLAANVEAALAPHPEPDAA